MANLTRIKNSQVTLNTLTGNTLANSLVYNSDLSVTGTISAGNLVQSLLVTSIQDQDKSVLAVMLSVLISALVD